MNAIARGLKVSTAILALTAGIAAAQDVEVLHWWTAGGEAAALNVLKEDLAAQGIGWEDMPVAGGGGEQAMTVLRARVTSGNSPTAVQMLGFDITDWAREGALANLNPVAEENGWEPVVPDAIKAFSKYDGEWIAAPVNVHSTNWVWANADVLEENGIEQPETWDEFVTAMETLQEAGITPLAHGGQPWQDATLFDAVVLSTGGGDFYKAALIDLDPEALNSDTMVEAFERMATLRGFVDDNFSGRDWNLASAMVINGEAGFQMMGDWAKGEFLGAGMTEGEDFLCFRFPGTQGSVTFNADQFAMFDQGGEVSPQQAAFAQAVMSPEFQVAFNVVKGSVPARTDVSDEEFGACGKKGMADLAQAAADGTLYGSMAHGYAVPASVKNAIFDVVTAHFNGEFDAQTAAEELATAVEIAQ
ncbi:sugar ABC transporter, periplasmic sugar-binding protein [Oceaniovalibus guishaninsula JLT2003]|uniref:Probable sugar-binding periplasmic protein n=1 Tax=Oceaniovalibus guishaninsula JLT2003 TaxID=1231392 RepID=K2HS85_9RHOB|nr:ABC transporter substrate-binding protein [Oceaniovalibus guishaninsula]EKE45549.1 sugar ABC transporter, periplasmic sugar-binding protein [Oceaniovalibus guishaninsula JLT2003]